MCLREGESMYSRMRNILASKYLTPHPPLISRIPKISLILFLTLSPSLPLALSLSRSPPSSSRSLALSLSRSPYHSLELLLVCVCFVCAFVCLIACVPPALPVRAGVCVCLGLEFYGGQYHRYEKGSYSAWGTARVGEGRRKHIETHEHT